MVYCRGRVWASSMNSENAIQPRVTRYWVVVRVACSTRTNIKLFRCHSSADDIVDTVSHILRPLSVQIGSLAHIVYWMLFVSILYNNYLLKNYFFLTKIIKNRHSSNWGRIQKCSKSARRSTYSVGACRYCRPACAAVARRRHALQVLFFVCCCCFAFSLHYLTTVSLSLTIEHWWRTVAQLDGPPIRMESQWTFSFCLFF